MEGDELWDVSPRHDCIFQSTPSAWRETNMTRTVGSGNDISIHSLRMEGDDMRVLVFPPDCTFQSTPSAWRETYLSPRRSQRGNISIHSLRMEGDAETCFSCLESGEFQSTPSAWRETRHSLKLDREEAFQSTPSAWRETCAPAPVAGAAKYFNPLPPHGGRHITLTLRQPIPIISIHSLRMEGDLKKKCLPRSVLDFNPLPPHGGRHFEDNESAEAFLFQSTPSAWRETFDT